MGHMRIPQEVVAQRHDESRVGGRRASMWRPRHGREHDYLFTLSRWHAIKYIGGDKIVVETKDAVDPRQVFPSRTMYNVDYGRALGIQSRVINFAFAVGGQPAGALLKLYVDKVRRNAAGDDVPVQEELGFYAVRYPASSAASSVASSVARVLNET